MAVMVTDPVFATPLTPGRSNLLDVARRLGRLVGIDTLHPWQERAIALATEYEEETAEGIIPYYKFVVVSVPRQTGKTEILEFLLFLLRFMGYMADNPPLMIYCAQTQGDAKRVVSTKIWPRLQLPWGKQYGFYYSSQPEDPHIRMSGKNRPDFARGKISILANKSGSGLGLTSSYINLDEARQFGDTSEGGRFAAADEHGGGAADAHLLHDGGRDQHLSE